MSDYSKPPDDTVALVQRLTALLYQDSAPAQLTDDVHRVIVDLLVSAEAQRNCIESLRDTIEEMRARLASSLAVQCDCGVHAG